MMIWKEFEVILVLLSAYYSETFVGEPMEVKGNLCQDSMSWPKFEQDSFRVQVQRATLSYVIGNLKMSKGQLKVKGILTTNSEPCLLAIHFYISYCRSLC
jgi:hypothetical protein